MAIAEYPKYTVVGNVANQESFVNIRVGIQSDVPFDPATFAASLEAIVNGMTGNTNAVTTLETLSSQVM